MLQSMFWITPLLLIAVVLVFAALRLALQRQFVSQPQPLIDMVDNLLPQTQCAQCGYSGCRPYAAAIVEQAEALNLCPPGGTEVHQQLTTLMGEQQASPAPVAALAAVAVIDETNCIGCTLCLPPCPVDAIVGANGMMHTVLAGECTGCELCIPACPVDCISMQPLPPVAATPALPASPTSSQATGCIRCGKCDAACPLDLPAQSLFHWIDRNQAATSISAGLLSCVECGLCDRVCPSDIPLADVFAEQIHLAQQDMQVEQQRAHLKLRYQAHSARLADKAAADVEKRQARMARNREGAAPWL